MHLNSQKHASERRGLDAMADFIFIELDLGKTFCDLAKNYNNEEKSRRALGRAWEALESAEKYMRKLQPQHSVFDEMTSKAESLRLELEAFTRPSG